MLPPLGLTPTPLLGVDTPTATLTSILLATATLLNSHPNHPPPPHTHNGGSPPDNGECSLLGPFAILVQSALGLLAMSALVFKRWRERPQRPVKIWFFDASKQVVGSVLVHIANLGMSMLSSGQFSFKVEPSVVTRSLEVVARMVDRQGHYRPNPCSFYLLNLAIDTTIGIPILIILLRILTALFLLTPLGSPAESIQSGNYGHLPRTWWWFKQSIIYFLGLMGMKICVLIIFLVLPWISKIGDWALRWTEGNEALQVVFVMLVFPLIMNATQYYIIDTFIKNQKPGEFAVLPDGDDGEEGLLAGEEDDGVGSGDEDAELKGKGVVPTEIRHKERKERKVGSGSGNYSPLKMGHRDYDPAYDGETSPIVGSASDRATGENK